MSRAKRTEIQKRKQTKAAENGQAEYEINLHFDDKNISKNVAIIAALMEAFDEEKGSCTTAENTGISIAHFSKKLMVLMFEKILPQYASMSGDIEPERAVLWNKLTETIKQSNTVIFQLYK